MPLPGEKLDKDMTQTHDQPRRWKVHIRQLEIVNMIDEACDPFLQIIIGGTHYVTA